MRALFQERCRNRIQISISVRRLREEFRNLGVVGVPSVESPVWSGVRPLTRAISTGFNYLLVKTDELLMSSIILYERLN